LVSKVDLFRPSWASVFFLHAQEKGTKKKGTPFRGRCAVPNIDPYLNGSCRIASMLDCTRLAVTYMDVGNADFAGAKICPWPIDPTALINIGHSKGEFSRCQASAIALIQSTAFLLKNY